MAWKIEQANFGLILIFAGSVIVNPVEFSKHLTLKMPKRKEQRLGVIVDMSKASPSMDQSACLVMSASQLFFASNGFKRSGVILPSAGKVARCRHARDISGLRNHIVKYVLATRPIELAYEKLRDWIIDGIDPEIDMLWQERELEWEEITV